MFAGISIAALKGAVVSLLEGLGKILLSVLCFVAIAALLSSILPNDPFLTYIEHIRDEWAPYAAWIDYFVPVRFITSCSLIFLGWRYVVYLYKKLGGIVFDGNGQGFFGI